jgi:peptidoglycan/LPS O-acetylase OafA/YrhL
MRSIFERLARGTKRTHALFVRQQDRLNQAIFPRIAFQSKLARSSQYRPEIDGLRALAVLPVLFFHTEIPGFSGGFVGVDIFYVISGYLITSVIAKDVAVGRFSFVSFYDRRIRRIFPALFAVVFFSLLLGALLLVPKDFAAFGKSLIAITFFVSNIFFKRAGGGQGYFGDDSHSQVLLHTWSLSVEEQFYLFFPTVLLLLARFAKKRTRKYLWLGALVSFVINIWATRYRPHGAFYLLIPRAWELLLGALLAMKAVPPLKRRVSREIVGFLGLGLIAWAVSVFTTDTTFPGFAALFPCLGAWLIIYAGENGPSSVRTILSFRPLVFIGVISYSLYLWHWPIFVFGKYFAAGDLSHGDTAIIIFSSLVMAFISFEFIESPFRGGDSPITRRQIFSFGLAASALSAVLGFAIYSSQGFPGRFSESTRQLISKNVERKSDFQFVCSNWKTDIKSVADLTFCNIGAESSKKIMFWGDSHVQQLYPLIQRIYDSGGLRDHGALFTVAPGCPPTEHMNRPEPGFHCDSFSHFAMMRSQEQDIDTVFIAFSPPGTWTLCPSVDGKCIGRISDEEMGQRFVQQLSEYIQDLKRRGKRVILSLPFPNFDKSPPDLQIRNALLRKFRIVGVAKDTIPASVRQQLAYLAERSGAEIFDPKKSLCGDRDCITEVDGVSIYKDDNHLAASQIGILQENMESTLERTVAE